MAGRAVHWPGMTRVQIAVPLGLLGFAAYIVAVMNLADWVLGLHLVVQLLFFAVLGVAWAWPAHKLILWAAHK